MYFSLAVPEPHDDGIPWPMTSRWHSFAQVEGALAESDRGSNGVSYLRLMDFVGQSDIILDRFVVEYHIDNAVVLAYLRTLFRLALVRLYEFDHPDEYFDVCLALLGVVLADAGIYSTHLHLRCAFR